MKNYQIKKTLLIALVRQRKLSIEISRVLDDYNTDKQKLLKTLENQMVFLNRIIEINLKKMDYE